MKQLDWPVILSTGLAKRGFLVPNKAAGAPILTLAVKMMALISGVAKPISAKQIRKGARDMANLSKHLSSFGKPGYSASSKSHGDSKTNWHHW